VSTSLINQFDPVKCAVRLKAELATLPKFLPEPFTFEWEQVRASLKSGDVPSKP
jgi:hypothetical protein